MFAAIICSLRKDVVLPVTNIEDYLNDLVTLALSTTHPIQIICAARIIGSLVNKWKDSKPISCDLALLLSNSHTHTCVYLDVALTEYVKATALVLEDTITQKATNSTNALQVYLWLTKALVLRTHALGYELTSKVIEWCGNNTMGSEAPQGFEVLIGHDELALNKATFATTTVSV